MGELPVSMSCYSNDNVIMSRTVTAISRWNAARAFASYLDENSNLYHNCAVLELGAGGGLPSIVAAKNGARRVCLFKMPHSNALSLKTVIVQVLMTDYPDDNLVENMTHNVATNIPVGERDHVFVQVRPILCT
jgi:nicotinamide N-methyltransferase